MRQREAAEEAGDPLGDKPEGDHAAQIEQLPLVIRSVEQSLPVEPLFMGRVLFDLVYFKAADSCGGPGRPAAFHMLGRN
ncbi:hypothetical protein FACS189483_08950 [Spirochaetia bacterium]|nr:hypothetical protein FACS189483_08950 [Spirochaetia bacterium]